jgi:hypothetical protein
MTTAGISVYDFVQWAIERIDPAELSAATSDYGYSDDSVETVMDAMSRYPEFVQRFGVILGEGEADRLAELAKNGNENDDVTIEEWRDALSRNKINGATGLAATETEKKPSWWSINGANLISGVLNIASGIFGGGAQTQVVPGAVPQQEKSGQMTFVWIIVGVVVLAAVGVIVMAANKKK